MQPGPWPHRGDKAAEGEELPAELKHHRGKGLLSPPFLIPPQVSPSPPSDLNLKWEGATDGAKGKGGVWGFFLVFLLEAVFIPLVKCQMKSFRPKLLLSSSLRLFTL